LYWLFNASAQCFPGIIRYHANHMLEKASTKQKTVATVAIFKTLPRNTLDKQLKLFLQ